jgi:large subunit ribosomal protein L25
MEKITLQKRDITGKKTKQLRTENLVPAVIYNSKKESTNVSIDKGIAVQLYKHATSTTILDLDIEGRELKAIVKEFDINPRTDELLHVAFFEIDPKIKMNFTIPFRVEGVSPAVKNNLGILVQVLDSLDVRCTLDQLIPEIVVNISGLEHPGQTVTVEDIELPKGLEFIHEEDSKATIVTITQLQKVEVIEESVESEDEEGEDTEDGDVVATEDSEDSSTEE